MTLELVTQSPIGIRITKRYRFAVESFAMVVPSGVLKVDTVRPRRGTKAVG